jgi:thymidylate kinase
MAGSGMRELNKPIYIIISGIDGSGKTAIIKDLQKRLESKGLSVLSIWMRYNHIIIKPIHILCRLVGLSRKRPTSQGNVWRHEFYRCQPFCSFYIFLIWLDTWLAKIKLERQLKNDCVEVVICDRWVCDILIDLAVDSQRENLLEGKWYHRFMRLLPKNAKQYIIMRNKDKILACRPESREDPAFLFRLDMYNWLADKKHEIGIIDNNGSICDTVEHIMEGLNKLEGSLSYASVGPHPDS